VATVDAVHGGGDAGRGLVLWPGIDIHSRFSERVRPGAGSGFNDGGGLQEWSLIRGRGELLAELPEGQMLSLLLDQPEDGGIPKRRRPANAEHHFVALRGGEQFLQPPPDAAHQVLYWSLPVRGAQQGGPGRLQRLNLFRANLRRAGAESSVGGQQVAGYAQAGVG
jgi:hypothetical protein